MAATASPVAPTLKPGIAPLRAGQGNSFLLRRLHSLSGIVPIGAFLLEHFISNFESFHGPEAYGRQVAFLNSLPFVLAMEIFFIWIPILYHGLYGIYIWIRGKSNVSSYPWVGNWVYSTQRYTGLIAFVYIGWHLYTQRWLTHGKSTYVEVQHFFQNPWFLAFTLIGILASSFHLGIGIWNFLCKWGLAATENAQRLAGRLGIAVALVFSLVGVLILISFRFGWHPFEFYYTK